VRPLVLALAIASLACAPTGREGEVIHIAEESAIIIWDAAAKKQHFIRRASFETKAKGFGFLVPTPTAPELEDADESAFHALSEITSPPRDHRVVPKGEVKAAAVISLAAPRVKVLQVRKIAGFEAAVLDANDANLLDGWLKQHGYSSNPDLLEWYRPYVEQGWIITAFKIDSEPEGDARIETSAVRMSFKTERPFFPYREPASAQKGHGGQRLLRIYLIADARYEGEIGKGGAWPASTVWSGPLENKDRESLLRLLRLPATTASGSLRLTEFEDRSSPRPGVADLTFGAGSNQSTVKRTAPGEFSLAGVLETLAWVAMILGAGWILWRLITPAPGSPSPRDPTTPPPSA
jgi:hypothetical protein